LVGRVAVTPLVLAGLALLPLVTIEGAAVAATPTILKVGVRRRLDATFDLVGHGFLLRGNRYSQGHFKPASPMAWYR
jgi:hypothetical protein